MALSPREVETKQFVTALRGYDVDEVRTFLVEVSDEMRQLVQALYALLPDDATSGLPGQPDIDDLVRLGSTVSEEVVRLAQAGRAAQVDADSLLRNAETESRHLQSTATEVRLRALREAGQLIKRAQEDAEAILEAARQREQELVGRLSELERRLEQATNAFADVRSQVRQVRDELSTRAGEALPRPAGEA